MPDGPDLSAETTRWDEAFATVDRWLVATVADVSRLGAEAHRLYPSRTATNGWRVPVTLESGVRRLDILVGESFPFDPPRLALVDPPPHLTWPHLESDGCICLLSSGTPVLTDDPVAMITRLLMEAVQWIEQSEGGTNLDDFRVEFLSYWAADAGVPPVRSLLEPHGPSRVIAVHRMQGYYVVAEDAATLNGWLNHAVPTKLVRPREFDPALLIWLDLPMLPAEYPTSAADIVRRVQQAGLGSDIERLGANQLQRIVVVFGAESGNGPAFAAVVLRPGAEDRRGRRGLERGFRPGRTPAAVLANRFLGSSQSRKAEVERIDAGWIHGRDADPHLPTLRAAKVVVIGCGSLGGPVALSLAQAGVGALDLVDPETLKAANVGRHSLGASEIGVSKAIGLAARIQAEYPHIHRVEGHCEGWKATAVRQPERLTRADLLISTIGDWPPEAALNAWRRDRAATPDLLFGWTEPHAVAGHAVGLVRGHGCLACGLSAWGEPLLPVGAWPNGTGQRGEPACGVVYQPYGPVDAAHVAALITEAAIDMLLGRVEHPFHRLWVARESVLSGAGGVWSEAWVESCGGRPLGGVSVDRRWPSRPGCPICGGGDRPKV